MGRVGRVGASRCQQGRDGPGCSLRCVAVSIWCQRIKGSRQRKMSEKGWGRGKEEDRQRK